MSSTNEQVRSFIVDCSATSGCNPVAGDAIEEFRAYYDKESLEMQLLEMETALINNTENKVEIVQGLFRDMHSLKGSSGLLKIDSMTHLLHNLEDVLGAISNSVLNISAVKRTDIFDFFLQGFDLVERLVITLQKDPAYVLKNNKELFGFYIRVINEARSIAENIDQYMEISEINEDMF